MVNRNNGSTPGSSGVISTPVLQAGASNTGSGNASGSSTPSGSSAGAGASLGASVAVSLPLSNPSKGLRKELTALANGFGTQLPASSTLAVSGQSVTVSSIVSVLQADLALYAAVDQAVQAAKSSRLPLRAALPGFHQYVVALKAALIAQFGKGNPVLGAFGFSVAKPRQLTAAQKTARAEKAVQTRKLRGTGGARQKAGVKFIGTAKVQTTLSGTTAAGGSATSPAGATSAGSASTPSGSSGSGTTSGA